MKFNKIRIDSHPRSGSHYLAHLIDINFFDGSNYLRHYGGHPYGNINRIIPFNGAQIYMCRNTNDALKSLFNMRDGFGLDENNFEKFKNTKIVNMFNPNLKVKNYVNNVHSKRTETTVSDYMNRLPTREYTPFEFIENHKKSWFTIVNKCSNLLIVNYDNLIQDFPITMQKISNFLKSDVKTFKQVTEKIGWSNND